MRQGTTFKTKNKDNKQRLTLGLNKTYLNNSWNRQTSSSLHFIDFTYWEVSVKTGRRKYK